MESPKYETVQTEGESSPSTSSEQSKSVLLSVPKSSVAIVGNSPVVLGQKLLVMKNKAEPSSTSTSPSKEIDDSISITQVVSAKSSYLKNSTESLHAKTTGPETSKSPPQQLPKSNPFEASQVIKDLICKRLNEESHKPVPETGIGMQIQKSVKYLENTPGGEMNSQPLRIAPKPQSEFRNLMLNSLPVKHIIHPQEIQSKLSPQGNSLSTANYAVNLKAQPMNVNLGYVNVDKIQRPILKKIQPNTSSAPVVIMPLMHYAKVTTPIMTPSQGQRGGHLNQTRYVTRFAPQPGPSKLSLSATSQPAIRDSSILLNSPGNVPGSSAPTRLKKPIVFVPVSQNRSSIVPLTATNSTSKSLSQPSPVLQAILSSPASQSPILNSSSSTSHSISFKLNVSKTRRRKNYKVLIDQSTKFHLKNKLSVRNDQNSSFTCPDSSQKDKPVMVMRPVLESESSSYDNDIEVFQTNEAQSDASNSNQFLSHKEIDKACQRLNESDTSSDLNLKIQSVFSLAKTPNSAESATEEEGFEQRPETDVEFISDSDSDEYDTKSELEEGTSFKVFEDKWKTLCPPAYVVLERLRPWDLKSKPFKNGYGATSTQCSHHCRARTLSYLCQLNLITCEKSSHSHVKNTCNKESPLKPMICENGPHVETDNRHVIMNDDIPTNIMKDDKGKQRANVDRGINQSEVAEPDSSSPGEFRQDDPKTNSPSQADTERSKLNDSILKEKYESSKMKEKLYSLRMQIEEKRSRNQTEKRKNKLAKDVEEQKQTPQLESVKKEPKQSPEKLPVVLGNLLKPRGRGTSQSNSTNTSTLPRKNSFSYKCSPSVNLSYKYSPSANTYSASPSTSSIVNSSSSKGKGTLHTSGSKAQTTPSSIYKSISTNFKSKAILQVPAEYMRIVPNNQGTKPTSINTFQSGSKCASSFFNGSNTLPAGRVNPSSPGSCVATSSSQPKVLLPLQKVHTALRSLASQVKASGQVLKGTQYVMLKVDDAPLLLKLNPDALDPKNNNPLGIPMFQQASVSPAQLKSQQNRTLLTSTQTTAISKSKSTISSAQITTLPTSMPPCISGSSSGSISNSSHTHFKKAVTAGHNSSTSTANQFHSRPSNQKSSTSNHVTSVSSSASSSKSVGPKANQHEQNITITTTAPPSSGVDRIVISSISSGQAAVHSALSSNSSLRSLLSTSAKTYNNSNSPLTHIPATSTLLPQRQGKRSSDHLNDEERKAKRRMLEKKYPLPPGVIIKCEPEESTEYDLDSNWSVTSEIHTGCTGSMGQVDDEFLNTPPTSSGHAHKISTYTYSGFQGGSDEDTDSACEFECAENACSPPPLDSIFSSSMDMDEESSSLVEINEAPPVLRPMPSLTVQQDSKKDHAGSSQRSVAVSKASSAKVYDSDYDSVGPSSSADSLSSGSKQSMLPSKKQSKIQELKDLLRQKQLVVENMLKKRSELPEMDLSEF